MSDNIGNPDNSRMIGDVQWSICNKQQQLNYRNLEMIPSKFSAQSLILEVFSVFERKINQVVNEEPLDKPLNKSLRRGEDAYLDNLLRALNGICNLCLPSVLDVLIKWYSQQQKISLSESGDTRDRSVKRTLAASYLFCVSLVEILPQLHFHPTDCEQHVNFIVYTSFSQISYRDPVIFGNNYNNSLIVAEVFSEVIGVLSQSHSKLVQKSFFEHLNEYRRETPLTSVTVRNIISLLMGMKFFRIKTNQITDFEMGVSFLHELGSYYLEIELKQKDLKHALAGLLVEILSPVAAQIKTEANVPSLIAFVDKLYGPTYDLVNKKQHKMAAYPLLTCLLCISQSKFFLSSWVQFLNLTLANLKNKDPKISRVALESLYRLLWVYIIRNSCEGNTATRSRLESICGSLFPRGNRNVIPRDAPLNIFVKIIHFIAQQKLDFAFKEIIFDLLGCNRASRSISIYPERMNIGLRALMVIADSLQQKEGPPGMPRSLAPIASGTMQRTKRTYITRPLTIDLARQLGLEQYYQPCRKAFDAILRALDVQVGRPLMLTSSQLRGKEYEDVTAGEIKSKLDLFRTCLAAIPRLLPDPASMSHYTLIEMLVRMCIHLDEELRKTAYQTLQNLVTECIEWRSDIIHCFLRFLSFTIQDTYPSLIESAQWFLLQLLNAWKASILLEKKRNETSLPNTCEFEHNTANSNNPFTTNKDASNKESENYAESAITSIYRDSDSGQTPGYTSSMHISHQANNFFMIHTNSVIYTMNCVEGFSFMMLCQLKPQIKKNAISMLNEAKQIINLLCDTSSETMDRPLIDVLDEATPYVLDKYIKHVSSTERQKWSNDFATACEKVCKLETDNLLVNNDKGNEYLQWDSWACALSGYCEYQFLLSQCPTAVSFAWPALFNRLNSCNQFIDPSNPQNESRGSLLRSSKSKSSASTLCKDTLNQESYLSLWQKYLVVCCALVQPSTNIYQNMSTFTTLTSNANNQSSLNRSFSPSTNVELEGIRVLPSTISSSTVRPSTLSSANSVTSSTSGVTNPMNCSHLFQKVVNMLRWENMVDMRDSVVLGVGSINPMCFEMLLEELNNRGLLREVQDKKTESNMRRRKRKDLLRLQLVRVIEVVLFRGIINLNSFVDIHSGSLSTTLFDFFDSIRQSVESDLDRDISILTSLRLHFAKSISLLINNVPIDKRDKLFVPKFSNSLFLLFFSWCPRLVPTDRRKDVGIYVEQAAIQAMCALSCCGSVFESYKKVLNDEEYLYRWLEALLAANNQAIHGIAEETLCLILHLNEHYPKLFERIIRFCYSESDIVSSRSFKALAMLFSKREYPCEFVTLFVVCQMFTECPDLTLRQTALLFLQILRRHFLDNVISRCVSIHLPVNNNDEEAALLFSPPEVDAPQKQSSYRALLNDSTPVKPKDVAAADISCRKRVLSILSSEEAICDLSKNYVQLTMPVFSEVCYRIEKARDTRQATLLTLLLSWVENIELIDPNCDISNINSFSPYSTFPYATFSTDDLLPPPPSFIEKKLNKIVTGSEEATQLLLNNMLYLTAKYGTVHSVEIEALWKQIASSFPSNLAIIVHYLFVVISLSPDSMLPIAKRICSYLLNQRNVGDRLVAMLVEQLTDVGDTFRQQLVRSEMEPYYRWLQPQPSTLLQGKQHTKDPKLDETVVESLSSPTNKHSFMDPKFENNSGKSTSDSKQLPMPPYGGHYSKLSLFLPSVNQGVTFFSRHNLALILLSDLIGADSNEIVNWRIYMPPILHMSVVALDSHRPLICSHGRRAIINICFMYSKILNVINLSHIATILLKNQLNQAQCDETFNKNIYHYDITSKFFVNTDASNIDNDQTVSKIEVSTQNFAVDYEEQLLRSDQVFTSSTELLVAIIHCLSQRMDEAFWKNEDVSVRCWKIKSAETLFSFVRHIVEYFVASDKNFAKHWSNIAMEIALSSKNRHFAGRSFHVASALCQSPGPKFIAKFLSRLLEIIGDANDETQGYLSDLMLCVQNLIQYLHIGNKSHNDEVNELRGKMSTSSTSGHSRSISYTPMLLQQQKFLASPDKNKPSSSLSNKKEARHSLLIESKEVEASDVNSQNSVNSPPVSLNRSKSAIVLNLESDMNANCEAETIASNEDLCQILNISVAMLESNIENEFLLALHLIDEIFTTADSEMENLLENLGKTVNQLDWSTGSIGIIGLVSRGTAYQLGYESTISILTKCIRHLKNSVVTGYSANKGKDISNAICLIIVSILPYCLINFDSPTQICCVAAEAISNFCSNSNDKCSTNNLESNELKSSDSPTNNDTLYSDSPRQNLATMMDQYSGKSFSRDRFQWAKCVINYLVDAFNPDTLYLIVFLTEVLERGPPPIHTYLLNLINLLVSYGDLSVSPSVHLNAQVIRTIIKQLQSTNNREAACILKSFVDQWNAISVTSTNQNDKMNSDKRIPTFDLHIEQSDSFGNIPNERMFNYVTENRQTNFNNMGKVREKLLSLLTLSAVQVGLPKSSSVIFSQFSSPQNNAQPNDSNNADMISTIAPISNLENIPAPSATVATTVSSINATSIAPSNLPTIATSSISVSTYGLNKKNSYHQQQDLDLDAILSGGSGHLNSGGGTLGADCSSITTDSFPRVFKEFDFLEAEHDSISESTDSCFNWLSTMRSPRCALCHGDGDGDVDGGELDDAGDEHDDDFLHGEDNEYYEEDDLNDNGRIANKHELSESQIEKRGESGCSGIHDSPTIVEEIIVPPSLLKDSDSSRGNNDDSKDNTQSIERLRRRLRNVSTVTPHLSTRMGYSRHMMKEGRQRLSNDSIKGSMFSRTSDESINDVSSDRTPIQSAKHSDNEINDLEKYKEEEEAEVDDDESCPSCPISENEGDNHYSIRNKFPKKSSEDEDDDDDDEENVEEENSHSNENSFSKCFKSDLNMPNTNYNSFNANEKVIKRKKSKFSSRRTETSSQRQRFTKHKQKKISTKKSDNTKSEPSKNHNKRNNDSSTAVSTYSNNETSWKSSKKNYVDATSLSSLQTSSMATSTSQLRDRHIESPSVKSFNSFADNSGKLKNFISPRNSSNFIVPELDKPIEGGFTTDQYYRSDFSTISAVVPSLTAPYFFPTAQNTKGFYLSLECNHHTSGQVEQQWNSMVSEVPNDQDGETTSASIMLFSQLLRESCLKLSGLLRDSSHLLTISLNSKGSCSVPPPSTPYQHSQQSIVGLRTQTLDSLSMYFSRALSVILMIADCPFLFVTPQFLRASNLLQTTKFCLYELREHFETFLERCDQCIRTLNSVKSFTKLMMIGGSSNASSLTQPINSRRNQEADLCKSLHKLFFQLLLMFEKLYEIMQKVQQSYNAHEYDLSPALSCLQRDLLNCFSPNFSFLPPQISSSCSDYAGNGVEQQLRDSLVLYLANKQYKNALIALRQLRSLCGAEFGCCEQMDVEAILIQFCQNHKSLRTWAVVVGGSNGINGLAQNCSLLKENNVQLAALIRLLVAEASTSSNAVHNFYSDSNTGANTIDSISSSIMNSNATGWTPNNRICDPIGRTRVFAPTISLKPNSEFASGTAGNTSTSSTVSAFGTIPLAATNSTFSQQSLSTHNSYSDFLHENI